MCARVPQVAAGLHPAVWRIYWMIGKWEGLGNGGYPTISEPFNYRFDHLFELILIYFIFKFLKILCTGKKLQLNILGNLFLYIINELGILKQMP
jgi:hypothetical protein